MFKRLYVAGALVATLLCAPVLSGCNTLTNLLTNTTTVTAGVANSVKGANDLFTFMATGANTYVKTFHPSTEVVQGIDAKRAALKTELDKINADYAAGKSPVYDLFNDALKAWRDYNTEQGVQS